MHFLYSDVPEKTHYIFRLPSGHDPQHTGFRELHTSYVSNMGNGRNQARQEMPRGSLYKMTAQVQRKETSHDDKIRDHPDMVCIG